MGQRRRPPASGGLREELLGQWPARCECNCTKQLLGATTWAVEQSETERVSPLSGNRICHLTFKRGFDHRILFRRGLEILLVQLHADAVALPHDDCCAAPATPMMAAVPECWSLSMVASRYWLPRSRCCPWPRCLPDGKALLVVGDRRVGPADWLHPWPTGRTPCPRARRSGSASP